MNNIIACLLVLLIPSLLFGVALFGIGYLNERNARAMSKNKKWYDEE